MRFIREREYKPDQSLSGKPLITLAERLWISRVASIMGAVWGLTVIMRVLASGSVALEASSVFGWSIGFLAVGSIVLPFSCLVHEVLHHLAAPGGLRSDRNIMVLKWGWLPVAAAHEAWVSRNRQLLIHLMPLAGVTLLALLLTTLVDPAHRIYVAFFWEMNLLLCVADLYVAYRMVRLQPEARICGATVREPGSGSVA